MILIHKIVLMEKHQDQRLIVEFFWEILQKWNIQEEYNTQELPASQYHHRGAKKGYPNYIEKY